MGASTPHFALQLRNRISALIRDLPAGHPARIEGEREIARLDRLAYDGEIRGHEAEPGLEPLPSVALGESDPRLVSIAGLEAGSLAVHDVCVVGRTDRRRA